MPAAGCLSTSLASLLRMVLDPMAATEPSLPRAERVDPFANEVWPKGAVLARRLLIMLSIATGAGLILLSKIPVCPMANLSGHPCPGCGLTRATLDCLRGHFGEAFHMHPLVFVATPALGACIALAAHSYLLRGKVRFSPRVSRVMMPIVKVLYVALIGLWIIRFFGAFGGPVPVTSSIFSHLY